MGNCACLQHKTDIANLQSEICSDSHANNQINQYMNENEKMDKEILKILLLGVGSSGKSTLFRQLENIYGDGFSPEYITDTVKSNVQNNSIESILKLIKQSENIQDEYTECKINFDEQIVIDAIKIIASNAQSNVPNIKHMSQDDNSYNEIADIESVGSAISLLWSLPGIKNTYHLRSLYSIYENTHYFLNNSTSIFTKDYTPSVEDVIKTKIITTGINERKYEIYDTPIHIFDVGGQRNERKKWIQLFEGVNALIYVAALSHYATVCFEDEKKNSMLESLQVFDEIVNLKWFSKSQCILFLNKDDVFRERLKDKIPLRICFGAEYVGSNYSDPCCMDNMDDDDWFEHCYNESIDFIKKQFIKRNKRQQTAQQRLYIHVTSAIIQNSIQMVFADILSAMTRKNLVDALL